MRASVSAAHAVIAFVLLSSAAAAAEEKSTKPRIAVIEFKNKADGTFHVDSAQWGEWIADVERPQAAGSWAKAEGLGVSWDVAESPGTPSVKDRLRTAGPKDGWGSTSAPGSNETITTHGNRTESKLPGKRTPPTVTLKRGMSRSATALPPGRGSVLLSFAQPWAGCAVGDRFNGAYLTIGATHRYQLSEGHIVRCGGTSVTVNFVKVAATAP